MDITDYIPNVFGRTAPTTYDSLQTMGLITPQQVEQQRKTANIQGLLGAGLALAQGMSRTGPRRSAAENILGALAGGFGASGGAYQQGIQNIVQQQQLQSAALQQQQAANRVESIKAAKLKYPDLAPLADIDPGKFADEVFMRERIKGFGSSGGEETPESLEAKANAIYATGVPGLKPYADSLMAKARQLAVMPRPAVAQPAAQPTAETAVQPAIDANQPALPPVENTASRGKVGQIQFGIDKIDAELSRTLELPQTQENINYQNALKAQREILANQQDRFAVMEYDFTDLKGLPPKYQGEISQLEKQAQSGTLDKTGLNSRIEKVYTRLQEDEKGRKLEGNAATFAQMKFGKTDRTQLSGPELAEVLRFENAPTADQLAQLQRAAIDTKFTTGRDAPIPIGRGQYIVPGQGTTAAPVVEQQVAPTRQVTTQTPRQAEAVKTSAPENAPAETKNLYSYNKNALINKPDSEYSPAKKQVLREKKAPLQSAVTYSLTSIKDARDAALALKNNPQYIDALTGRFSPLLSGTVGGVVLSQDAKTANDLLQNILTRSFIKEIQAMREASPTGGAVGSVTEKEMDALSKVSAALSVGMNKNEFIKQLDNYLSIANRSIKNIPTEYSKTYGYDGEFDEILTAPGVSTAQTSGKTPVQLELERRKQRKP